MFIPQNFLSCEFILNNSADEKKLYTWRNYFTDTYKQTKSVESSLNI